MAIYRNVQMSFWTDSKIADDFTPEDKYFYLYLLTNPHTSICGCYELSIRQMSIETGYSKETVEKLIDRMVAVHNVVRYSKNNKEVLLLNWCKYNWTSSPKVKKSIVDSLIHLKTPEFKQFIGKCYDSMDTVSIGYEYPMDTSFSLVSDSLVSDSLLEQPEIEKKKPEKHKYGEYGHVLLTDEQYTRLIDDYGEKFVLDGIRNVDEYCQEHGKTYKDYNLTLRKWGIKAPKMVKPVEKKKSNEGLSLRNPDDEQDALAHPISEGWMVNDDGYWINKKLGIG